MKHPIFKAIFILLFSFSLFLNFILSNYSKKLKKETFKIVVTSTSYDLVVSHIEEFEGFSEIPYQILPDTNWYIGYGYKMKSKNQFKSIDKQTAREQIYLVLNQKLAFVNRNYSFEGNKALAVATLCYRWGEGSLIKSNLHKYLLKEDIVGIVREWSTINLYNGKPHKKMNSRVDFELYLFFKNN